MSDQFTILIQGPLNNVSLENIENYKKFGTVIISHWDEKHSIIEKEFPILKKYKSDPKVKIISKPLPDRNDKIGIEKNSTFYWAVESCYHGFMACETEYVIKTRSDEYFTDLSEIINKTLQSKGNVLVCGSIFVRNFMEIPFHVGDHIFGLKTESAKKMYQHLMDMYNGKIQLEISSAQGIATPFTKYGERKHNVCAEQILGLCFLKKVLGFTDEDVVKGYLWTGKVDIWEPPNMVNKQEYVKNKLKKMSDNGYDYLQNNDSLRGAIWQAVYVVDVNDLGDYQVRWAHGKKIWSSKGEKFTNPHGINNQKDLYSFFSNIEKTTIQAAKDGASLQVDPRSEKGKSRILKR